KSSEVPMCGVPHHAATSYINKLVNTGHKVAVCEQLEDPSTAKGIVKRDVIRVISPGTRLDPDALEAKTANLTHAAMCVSSGSSATVVWAACDFTTGKLYFGISSDLDEWLSYARAQGMAELLFPETESGEKFLHYWRENNSRVFAQTVPA